MTLSRAEAAVLLLIGAAVFVWSGIDPHDRLTWWLEVAPVLIALPLLFATRTRFPLTPLLYRLILIHAIILMIGAHYTYARVPLGFMFQEWFDLARNHYDRLGHFAQGFIPAILAREILLRCSPLGRGGWLFWVSGAFCLAFSAFFEMLEWWVALLAGAEAEAFLATQGDPWDTQWDMFLALVGAVTALLSLARVHDRALARAGLYPPRGGA